MLVMAAAIWASVGHGLVASSVAKAVRNPGWRKPYCGTCSCTQACCTADSPPSGPANPSTAVIRALHVQMTHNPAAARDLVARTELAQ